MTNPSRIKGTRFESAIVKYARANGFPLADRRPLKGRLDEGDILLCPGVVVEAKAGKSAQQASYAQKLRWLADAEQEARNGNADIGVLVVQRRGYGIDRMEFHEFWWTERMPFEAPACVTLHNGLLRLRWAGWGDAL